MRTLAACLLVGSLSLSTASCGGESGQPPVVSVERIAVPSSALPRTGSVWDPPEHPLEIALGADGTITFLGREVGLEELRDALKQASRPPYLRNSDGTSRLDVVLRVNPALPWTVVQWVLMTCSDPNAQIFRLYFAVLPEVGGDEGVIPTFLPRDRSIRGVSDVVGQPVVSYLFAADGTADSGAIFAALRSALAATSNKAVEINTPWPRIPRTSHVVSLLDLALRAGAERVFFGSAPAPLPRSKATAERVADPRGEPGSVAWLRAWVAEQLRDVPGGLKVKVGQTILDASAARASIPPPPARHGRSIDGSYLDVPKEEYLPDEPEIVPEETELPPTAEETEVPKLAPGPMPNDGLISAGGGMPAVFPFRSARLMGRPDVATDAKSDAAIEVALAWLAAHQSPGGGWEAEGFGRWCNEKPVGTDVADGKGQSTYDVGVTGLALLAFLGAGHTMRSDHPVYGKVVGSGLHYLRNAQDADGCFGPRTSAHYNYNHAIATLAMVEAFGMTGSSILKNPVRAGLRFIAIARNPGAAWRYGIKPGDNDTSVTGWMTLALAVARMIDARDLRERRPSSLDVDAALFEGVRSWLDKMTDAEFGRVGYQQRGTGPARPSERVDAFPADRSESMTAVGVLLRVLMGEDSATSDLVKKGTALLVGLPPVWNAKDGSIDLYYWQVAALAMHQVGGPAADVWRTALSAALVPHQRLDGEPCGLKGSWDPIDPWGPEGGRVYATAMATLALEAPYRYPRIGAGAGR